MAKKEKREGKSYTSLILGIVVVVIALTLIVVFINRQAQNISQTKPEVSSQKTENLTEAKNLQTTYTVVEGDYLWSIAESYYKSGYSWVDIAKANDLENPDLLFVGTKLIMPIIKETVLTSTNEGKETLISEASYTVVKGDCLWDIAVRAYGDGYRFVDIAKANNLVSPDLIHSGNVLVIPR